MEGNLTSKDENGRILVDGNFKICNIAENCSGSVCNKNCLINRMIHRLYQLEHPKEGKENL